MKSILKIIGVLALSVSVLTGCEKKDITTSGLTIIAGSEIQNISEILKDASDNLGFPIEVSYSGTIEGVEAVISGANKDIAWFGNAKYFYDTPESSKRIKQSEKIMFSPVILGFKPESFKKLGMSETKQYSWKDIASIVEKNNATYAMTDPSVSNTGYVALMGVVYSTANQGENVKVEDVNKAVLQKFFKGQKLTAKSSSWLMDSFNKDNSIDFVVNYESAILANQTKLIAVYPNEGIVTSDYPMLLINQAKAEKYKALVAYLKSKPAQEKLLKQFKYRSTDGQIMANQSVFDSSKLLIEMPFNPSNDVSDSILVAYFNEYKKPAKFAFVIDTSGSMGGSREANMKLLVSSFSDGTLSKYGTFRNREEVITVTFSDKVQEIGKFSFEQREELKKYSNNLIMQGGTAMFDAVAQAMVELDKEKAVHGDKYRYSIVVLTDGITNTGANFNDFNSWFIQNGYKNKDYRVFPIAFGDADMKQITDLANLTNGKVFDGKSSLSAAFKEIRSYQ